LMTIGAARALLAKASKVAAVNRVLSLMFFSFILGYDYL
jgi:hypothetical protein